MAMNNIPNKLTSLEYSEAGENLGSNYSQIITSELYNTLMTDQHLYIKAADRYIAKVISRKLDCLDTAEVIEIGCGPARITSMIYAAHKNMTLYGLDVDKNFINFAREKWKALPIRFINVSIFEYQHKKPVDVFYSQGFHHHVSKDDKLHTYLNNIFRQLKKGGLYIIGDEFIAEYDDANQREINLILWYSHIIANALQNGFSFLAQEEAKTLLDDLYEGRNEDCTKTKDQIKLVLNIAEEIDKLCQNTTISHAKVKAEEFLQNLKKLYNESLVGDVTMDLSRGDFKISCSEFTKEVEKTGFVVEDQKSFGSKSGVGAMGVFTLCKP